MIRQNFLSFGFIATALASMSNPAFASGGKGGNAGALVQRNGETLTIRKAGIRLSLDQPLSLRDLQDVPCLENTLSTLLMPEETRLTLLSAIRMRNSRRYFKVDDSRLNAASRVRLLEAYRSFTSTGSKNQLVIGALTQGRETYLFPAFFALRSDQARQTLLFHEALWVLNPKADYESVVRSEALFEACLEQSRVPVRVEGKTEYLRVCSDWVDSLASFMPDGRALPRQQAALEDRALGRLDRILDREGNLPGLEFFGKPFLLTAQHERDQLSRNAWLELWRNHLLSQVSRHPDSRLFRYLLDHYDSLGAETWVSRLRERVPELGMSIQMTPLADVVWMGSGSVPVFGARFDQEPYRIVLAFGIEVRIRDQR